MTENLPARISVRSLPVLTRRAVVAAQGRAKCPVEIEQATKAILACSDLLDLKQWGDKTDALAAWAKIYNDDKVGLEAKRLKLKIYRRASQVAEQLRPSRRNGSVEGKPGPRSALRDAGWCMSAAQGARAAGALSEREFAEVLRHPIGPNTLVQKHSGRRTGEGSDAYRSVRVGMQVFLTFVRHHSASELARQHTLTEAKRARENVREIQEWLDEYEQHLPKEKK